MPEDVRKNNEDLGRSAGKKGLRDEESGVQKSPKDQPPGAKPHIWWGARRAGSQKTKKKGARAR